MRASSEFTDETLPLRISELEQVSACQTLSPTGQEKDWYSNLEARNLTRL